MKKLWFLTTVLAGSVLAQEGTIKLSPTPIELPTRIGPLVANPAPHKYDPPAMGVSWQYSAPGASLTVYVYDAGVADLQDGADTVPVCIEFESAKQGALQAYREAKLISQNMVRLLPPEETPLMREASLELVREGLPMLSYVWITTVSKQFIKLRFSMDKRRADEAQDARRAILAAVGNALKPHLSPARADAEKKGTSIGVNMDLLNGDIGGAGLMYPMMLSALIDDAPETAPVCGGEVVPPYETELSLYKILFVDDEAGRKSKVGKQLSKANEAGFLDELVWVEVHRPEWGDTPPQALALGEYQVWKKKNLKRFKRPAFGSVSINHPRPLPMEAETAP